MTTQAFVAGVTLQISTPGSPSVFSALCEAVSISGIGKTNSLIDVTNFCSPAGTREYIAGLAEGEEVSFEMNYLPDNANQVSLRTSVDSQDTREFRLIITDGSASETFTFHAVCLSWVLVPSVDSQNQITFTAKITGDIVIS